LKYYLGTLSIYHKPLKNDHINWISLSGTKKNHSFLSRLNEIHISIDRLDKVIDKIEIDHYTKISYEIDLTLIKIYIEENGFLLNKVPIIIYYIDGDIDTIFEFNYIKDYQILKESGRLLNIYATS